MRRLLWVPPKVMVGLWPSVKEAFILDCKHFSLRNQRANWSHISYVASFGGINLNMPVLSMSHDQHGFHAILGKNNPKSSILWLNGQWPWVLVCNMRDMGLTNFVQMMILGWSWHCYLYYGDLNFCDPVSGGGFRPLWSSRFFFFFFFWLSVWILVYILLWAVFFGSSVI